MTKMSCDYKSSCIAVCGFDPEDLTADVGYWFKGSTSRKGYLTGEKLLNRLLDAGDITLQQVQRFQQAAVAFLVRAVEYAMKKLPMREPLIKHAMFLDVQQRVECGVEDALYFVDRFPELLPYNVPDKLSEEFLDYQSMDIAMPEDPATFDIESFWGNMASMPLM
ncbi:hypothetical protein NHX12_011549 [Muraenolepis orangiensis]|uniref:Uncharacterized protein n=1 Tax=Muraenolepis orangiensis TaxID=630683 RepID=A0A9Q0DGF3_9TELE|nr:hypothetical protein NHX12_011549 [Muraenolepis orangiensis]